jgi:hypothetical protein
MTTLTIFLAGFCLATLAWGIFYALIMLHRSRYTAPTKRRKNRDAPVPERDLLLEMFDELSRQSKVGEPIYMYGVTGEER